METFPPGYQYKQVADKKIFKLQITTKEEVEAWVEKLQNITKETWRTTSTFNTTAKAPRVIYKKRYRCHFNSRRRPKTQNLVNKRSKNNNCPAKMLITIQRFIYNSESKKDIKIEKDWPCVVEFREEHNHKLYDIKALRERPVGAEAKKCVLELFKKGHMVASAYHAFTSLKMEEYGHEYEEYACDRHYFPSKADFATLHAHFKESRETCEENQESDIDRVNIKLNEYILHNPPGVINVDNEEAAKESIPSEEEIETIKLEWQKHSNDIMDHLREDPVQFYPAIQTYLQNKTKYATNTNALLLGLHTAFTINTQKNGIQSTAMEKRTNGVVDGKIRNLGRGKKKV